MKALKTVHVATVVVARNACTFAVAFAEYLVFGSSISSQTMMALFVMLLGSVIYGFNDLNFEPVGYTWIFWNSVMFSTNQIYEKWAMGTLNNCESLSNILWSNSIDASTHHFPLKKNVSSHQHIKCNMFVIFSKWFLFIIFWFQVWIFIRISNLKYFFIKFCFF